MPDAITLRPARRDDLPLILALIGELADYERLAHEAVASEEDLFKALFGPRPVIEVVIAEADGQPAGFALFFASFSTFTSLTCTARYVPFLIGDDLLIAWTPFFVGPS